MQRRIQPIIVWLSIVLFAFIPVANGIGRDDRIIGDGVDVFGTFWFYWWVEHCVSSQTSPGFTDFMFHPDGKDIFAHTGGNLIDAFVSLPFQSIFGVPGFQAWFIAFVLVGNAVAFWVFARGLISSVTGVWAASILWMLNPFVLGELSAGRITQGFLWFLPLALHWFLKAENGPRPAILAGLFTGLQAWTYWFMAWFMVPAFACLAWAKWREGRTAPLVLIRSYALAALIAVAVAGPGVWLMFDRLASGGVGGLGAAGGLGGLMDGLSVPFGNEIQGWVANERQGIHTMGQWFWGALALSTLFLGAGRRRWAWVLGVSLAFAIGPTLSWGEDGSLPMIHYRLAFHAVPFLERLWFPYRWTVMAFLAAALVAGFWVQQLEARLNKSWIAAVPMALALVTVLEQAAYGTIPIVTRPYNVPQLYESLSERTGGIIELPMGVVRESLMWQPVHGKPLFGGMGENAPVFWTAEFKHAMGNRFVRTLRQRVRGVSSPIEAGPSDIEAIRQRGMRWVVFDRHLLMETLARSDSWGTDMGIRKAMPANAVRGLSDLMGSPVAVDGPLVVWDLQGGPAFQGTLAPDRARFDTAAWAGGDWAAYEKMVMEQSDH